MKIAVIGTGYVGSVTGACLAEKGNDVICADINEARVEAFSQGKVPFYEEGLESIVAESLRKKRLRFTTDVKSAMRDSAIVFIAVGTPQDEGGRADLAAVYKVADSFADVISGDDLYRALITKSTVPPGTTLKLREHVAQRSGKSNFGIANNPEFLKEGTAVRDFRYPDRVVIGTEEGLVETMLQQLYSSFTKTGKPIFSTDITSSELSKYASNAMLANRIAFMNELALLAGRIGADIDEVRKIVGSDPRIGPQFLFPGPGYGGSCFPKDVEALVYEGKNQGVPLTILDSVNESNKRQRTWLANKAREIFDGNLAGKSITLWGAAFKPRTDDVRESPAIYVARSLLEGDASVSVYDPEPRSYPQFMKEAGDKVKLCDDMYASLGGAHALLIVTDCDEFKNPDFDRMRPLMSTQLIIDARNLYSLEGMGKTGFQYVSLGRKEIKP